MAGIERGEKTHRYLDECKVKAVLLAGALLSASYLEC
jgi:hypothetical protein